MEDKTLKGPGLKILISKKADPGSMLAVAGSVLHGLLHFPALKTLNAVRSQALKLRLDVSSVWRDQSALNSRLQRAIGVQATPPD
jgi:hypothetical protein